MSISTQAFSDGEPDTSGGELEGLVDEWLKRPEIGLRFDPFRVRDAGHDPRLLLYLVDHGAFAAMWGDWPSFVFAPPGGGKTAFRVRLTHACRVGEGGRSIFPIVLAALPLHISLFESLNQAAAEELLLHLVYVPSRFLTRDYEDRRAIHRALEENLAESLNYRLDQIEDLLGQIRESDDWDLLAETFDPAACGLFIPPNPSEVQELIAALRLLPRSPLGEQATPEARFERFLGLLESLGYEAIYLLVDGVDAYLETQRSPDAAIEALQPFLERMPIWDEKKVYLKYFLPIELREPLEKAPDLLTKDAHVAIIEWTPGALREVISQRLQAAAEEHRAVNSLDALSAPALRGAEDELLQVARPFPRDLVALIEQMFIEHVRRKGPCDRLEPEDLDAAIEWYWRLEEAGSS